MSLPTTLSITTSIGVMVCSQANQDAFGVTYRGSQSDATYNVKGEIKIKHREEGSKLAPRERHSADVKLTYVPSDGITPSFDVQAYVHYVFPLARPAADAGDPATALSTFVTDAHADQLALLNWNI